MFHGNTKVTVYRGTSTDSFGDPQDVDTVIYEGLRASIIEQSRTVFVPADNQDRVIRYTRCRLPSNTIMREGDRIKDELSDVTYVVESVVVPGSPYAANDVRVDLKHVT